MVPSPSIWQKGLACNSCDNARSLLFYDLPFPSLPPRLLFTWPWAIRCILCTASVKWEVWSSKLRFILQNQSPFSFTLLKNLPVWFCSLFMYEKVTNPYFQSLHLSLSGVHVPGHCKCPINIPGEHCWWKWGLGPSFGSTFIACLKSHEIYSYMLTQEFYF